MKSEMYMIALKVWEEFFKSPTYNDPNMSFSMWLKDKIKEEPFVPKFGKIDDPHSVEGKREIRQQLINKFLIKKEFIDNFLNDFMEFIMLEDLHTNAVEQIDLKDISDNIKVSLGAIDQAYDDIFAFNHRVNEEKLLAGNNVEDNS